MNDIDDPIELEEPDRQPAGLDPDENIWMRGLWMVVIALLSKLAMMVLAVMALVQFFWMLLVHEKNLLLVDFGAGLGRWLHRAALFQSGASEDKPFPWRGWD